MLLPQAPDDDRKKCLIRTCKADEFDNYIAETTPRLQPNAACVKEHGDDHCGSEPNWSVLSWKRTFWTVHRVKRGHLF